MWTEDDITCTDIQIKAQKHLMEYDDIKCYDIQHDTVLYFFRCTFDDIHIKKEEAAL